jgi:hypothetical protein
MQKRVILRVPFILRNLYLYFLYKETCFNANDLGYSLPSVVVSLLQLYEDVFLDDFLMIYHQ